MKEPKCHLCRLLYGDEYGFPDLVIPDSAWAKISPTNSAGGLLCPNCINKRLVEEGINTVGCFTSGNLQSVDEATLKVVLDKERHPPIN